MTEKKLRLLVVHSSADLYGSDKSLLDFVRHMDSPIKVTVALPVHGPLVHELERFGATVIIGEVCKIQRSMFSPGGFVKIVRAVFRSVRFLGNAYRRDGFDLVYSNTVGVLGGALAARLWGVPHVWHVREIMSSSRMLTVGFRWLVSWLSNAVVCNSGQTLAWIKPSGDSKKYQVLWNGFDVPRVESDRRVVRAKLGAGDDDVLFVLVGRINWWKGQKLLVQAFSQLAPDTRQRTRLAIVGSAPVDQMQFEVELADFIASSGCSDRIAVLPHRADIDPIWDAADVVVVPSIEPEPFGRVAIEGMGFGKPVIAAGHGGLIEIVVDGVTGFLVKPRDSHVLATAVDALTRDAVLRHKMGEAGRLRQRQLFSVTSYADGLTRVMRATAAGPKKTVLFAHQSAEMYGSDKVLLWLVLGIQARGFYPIVLLPTDGPLRTALKGKGVETHIVQVAKLNRESLSFMRLLNLPFSLFSSVRETSRVVAGRKIDLVYSNTLAVMGAAVYARFKRIPHLWHVHELLLSPGVVRRGFPLMLRLLADEVVCNSTMTEQWLLEEQPALAKKTTVIWNGLDPRPEASTAVAADLRTGLKMQGGQLLVALVGRINRWKGQELLINTATVLWSRGVKHVHYLIVGGVVEGQEQLIDALMLRIEASPAREYIHLMEFVDDVWSVWDACDIAVVPSTEPEPFGLVAIEAMASSRPVVVAAHGGLLDIVEDGVTGLLFQPNDVISFSGQLQKLIASPQLREQLGVRGCARQKQMFSFDTQLNRTVELLLQMTSNKHVLNG